MANMREKVGEVLKGFLDSKTDVLTKRHEQYKQVAVAQIRKLEEEKSSLQNDIRRFADMSVFQFIKYKWSKRG